MRLADFIEGNLDSILAEWEAYARRIWPAPTAEPAELRDDAESILRATVRDMKSAQSGAEQAEKSKGGGDGGPHSRELNHASVAHGVGRLGSGFDLPAVVAEYRALRASVLRLWRESGPGPDARDLDDMTRFNESIDQSLAYAVRSFADEVTREREAMAAQDHASRIEAETANRAKDLFLATLSHELRTPLSAITGWTHVLRNPKCTKDELAEGLEVIERNTKTQVQLIDDVLDVSRIVAGKLQMDVQPCELMEIVSAGVDAVRPAAKARGITLAVQLDPSANHSSCDAMRMQQVVWNLVSNAVKFTPKGGRVSITLARENSCSQIQVTDSGVGISADVLPFVFDRFRQGDSTTRRQFSGLGLGLSIVKHIVEQHGGTVTAESAGKGLGSTFTVRIPIQAVQVDEQVLGCEDEVSSNGTSDEEHAEDASAAALRLDGVRVLVVDDEPDARRLLVKVLGQTGAVVTAASGVAEALESLPDSQAHVLVSDLGMPDEDGYDLIRQVREHGHDAAKLPAIALTAYAQTAHQTRALDAGFQAHVSKPVAPLQLISLIARLAGREDDTD
jgi:signal transduction histidine kinase/ActR/RegA family two-component response regulator